MPRRIQLGFGPDAPQNPVRALGGLLTLTARRRRGVRPACVSWRRTTPARPQLIQLRFTSFQKALAFYERPARATDLQAIASRLRGQPAQRSRSGVRTAARAGRGEGPRRNPSPSRNPPRNVSPGIPRHFAIGGGVLRLAIAFAIMVYARPRYLDRSVAEQARSSPIPFLQVWTRSAWAVCPRWRADAGGSARTGDDPGSAGAMSERLRAGRRRRRSARHAADARPACGDGTAPLGRGADEDAGVGSRRRCPTAAIVPPPIVSAPGHLEDGLVTLYGGRPRGRSRPVSAGSSCRGSRNPVTTPAIST